MDAIGAAQLGEDAADIRLGAGLGHAQACGYRGVGESIGEQRHDLELTRAQRGEAGRRGLSGTIRDAAEATLAEMDMRDGVDLIISSELNIPGKPDPAPFLEAVRQLDMPKEYCLAVDNAPAGVSSAVGAGLPCVAVATYLSKSDLTEADHVVENMKELTRWVDSEHSLTSGEGAWNVSKLSRAAILVFHKVSETRIFRDQMLGLRIDRVVTPDGETISRKVVEYRKSAAVVPVFSNGQVLLVRHYRHPIGKEIWDIPGGTIETAEDPAEAVAYATLACADAAELAPAHGLSAGGGSRMRQMLPVQASGSVAAAMASRSRRIA